jgi:hypothetical protein
MGKIEEEKTDLNDSDVVTCPLYGNRFTPNLSDFCSACNRHSACDLVICPNCGFEFPKS